MKTHTLTEEQIANLIKGDPDTVSEIRKLIDPPRVVKWERLGDISGAYVDSATAKTEELREYHTDESDAANIFAHESQAIGFGIAAAKLTQVVERARGGWKPKWDATQNNWCVYVNDGKFLVNPLHMVTTPFALPTRELAEQFLETCREDLEAYYLAVQS